jgi:hypothetical protein
MKEYILVWRFFPKLFLGALFVVEFFIVLTGTHKALDLLLMLFHILTTHFSGPTLLVAIVLMAAVIANIGVFGLALLSGLVGRVILRIFHRWLRNSTRNFNWIGNIIEPTANVAFQLYKRNVGFYAEFFRLKQLATVELKTRKQIIVFAKEVDTYVTSLPSPWEAEAIGYYTALTQVQKLLDRISDEVQTIWNLILVILLGVPSLIQLNITAIEKLLYTTLLLVFSLSLFPILIRRKRILAVLILCGFLDCFTLGVADVEDREGEPVL